jgi:hypothetical protein
MKRLLALTLYFLFSLLLLSLMFAAILLAIASRGLP